MGNHLKIKRNTLFLIGYIILFIQFWIKDLLEINEYLFYIPSFALLFLSINFNKLSLKECIIVFVMNFIGILVFIFSKSMTILKIALVLSAAKERDMDKIIKWTFWFEIVILIIHMFCSIVLGMGEVYVEADFGRGIIERRFYFGFSHANTLHLLGNFLMICYLYTYFIKKKNKYNRIIDICACIIFTIVLYSFTKSRTGLIIGFISILLAICYSEKNNEKFKILKNYKFLSIGYLSIIICMIGIIYFGRGTEIYSFLNRLMTGRLNLTNYVIEEYDINLFGQSVTNEYTSAYGNKITIAIDQGIVIPLINYGLIASVILYVYELKLIKKCCLEKQYNKIMIIMILILYSITENILFYPFTNFSILFIADIIYSNKKKSKYKLSNNITGGDIWSREYQLEWKNRKEYN